MPQNLVNARGAVWRASTRTLYVKVPLDVANNQSAALLVFSVPLPAGGGGGGASAAQQCDAGALTQGAWSALSAGVAILGLIVGIVLARNVYGGKPEEAKENYSSLN
jgi:hypothetical protein